MSLGAMMAGGNPVAGRENEDFYPTPWEVTQALLDVEEFDGIIHEPCCGDGAMSKVLIDHGLEVKSSDLMARGYGVQRDYFTIQKPVAHNVITNPPFKLAKEMLIHSMTLSPRKIAFVLKAGFWHAKTRKPLFDLYRPRHIYPLTWRPDFMGLGRPTMEVMWCVWHRGYKGYPDYIPLDKPLANRAKSAISDKSEVT